MKKLTILAIDAYKITLSPFFVSLLGGSCRFEPTCSHYAKEAITKHGILKGGKMSLVRILRCNPFSKGGWDPVPSSLRLKAKSKKKLAFSFKL